MSARRPIVRPASPVRSAMQLVAELRDSVRVNDREREALAVVLAELGDQLQVAGVRPDEAGR